MQRDEEIETTQVLGVTAFGALAAAGMAYWLVAGRVLAPLRLVRQAAERIGGSSDLSRRLEVRGTDDVAALAATFNVMLDRLEAAFATQRRFVDDAGHELRTPLTVIRGHLELMGDDPRERAETRELLLDELDRMSRIVEDLLVLARPNARTSSRWTRQTWRISPSKRSPKRADWHHAGGGSVRWRRCGWSPTGNGSRRRSCSWRPMQ